MCVCVCVCMSECQWYRERPEGLTFNEQCQGFFEEEQGWGAFAPLLPLGTGRFEIVWLLLLIERMTQAYVRV